MCNITLLDLKRYNCRCWCTLGCSTLACCQHNHSHRPWSEKEKRNSTGSITRLSASFGYFKGDLGLHQHFCGIVMVFYNDVAMHVMSNQLQYSWLVRLPTNGKSLTSNNNMQNDFATRVHAKLPARSSWDEDSGAAKLHSSARKHVITQELQYTYHLIPDTYRLLLSASVYIQFHPAGCSGKNVDFEPCT